MAKRLKKSDRIRQQIEELQQKLDEILAAEQTARLKLIERELRKENLLDFDINPELIAQAIKSVASSVADDDSKNDHEDGQEEDEGQATQDSPQSETD
jgi:hypothetical protein